MKFSFGICLSPDYNVTALFNIIRSIDIQKFPYDYEILTIGGEKPNIIHPNFRHIDFDENQKPGWITRKKNILVQESTGDWLTLMHDYYSLEPNWVDGMWLTMCAHDEYIPTKKPYHAVCCRIENVNGTRHSDWLVNERWMDYLFEANPGLLERVRDAVPDENHPRWVCGLPYKINLSKFQYISGGFISGYKSMFERVPFDERLVWGQEEDLRWSEDFSNTGHHMVFSHTSKVKLLKPNKWELKEIPDFALEKLIKLYKEHNEV